MTRRQAGSRPARARARLGSHRLAPVALALAGGLASRELGLLFWGSAVAIELTAHSVPVQRPQCPGGLDGGRCYVRPTGTKG